jgi:hypothetical protein
MTVVKFPYIDGRRVHSRKPRISKNGTPEERAAKAAAEGIEVPAEIRKAQLLEIHRLLIIIDDRRQLLKALATLRAFPESKI